MPLINVSAGLPAMHPSSERGIALITALLVTMLMTALLMGFTAVVMSDQRYRFIDRDRSQAFYAASGATEKLTADLGNVFFANIAPTAAQISSLTSSVPSIANVSFSAATAPTPLPSSSLSSYYCVSPKTIVTKGTAGYTIQYCADANGNPTTTTTNPIKSGPYAGLIALQTPYQLDVTAKTSAAGEVHLVRTIEAVAIPVFQFGIFSDVDQSFFAGPNFSFGGRVHTNGNLFLSEGGGSTLTLNDKVTAVGEIIRQRLQNGVSIDTAPAHTGTVSVAKGSGCTNASPAPSSCRALARTEGSLVDGLGSAQNEPTWHTISLSTYNSYIRSGRTGAKPLNLPLLSVGGTNADLIRRPVAGEDVANNGLLNERLFTKASLRILLSDTAADITSLPTVTATAPVQLDGNWNTTVPNNGIAYGPVAAALPPIARTPGPNAMAVNGAQAAGWTTLPINAALPAYYKIPATIKLASGANTYTLTCTGKTPTTFTGCATAPTPGATVAAGATVTTAANAVNSTTPSTATTASWASPWTTVTVTSTAAFSPAWFFVTNSAGTQSLVTCTGYTAAPAFTGCAADNAATTPAVSNAAAIVTNALSQAQTGTIGGYLKIERQATNGTWTDVTMEILNDGIGAPNLLGTVCADPSPNAILRIQRLRDNAGGANAAANGGGCNYAGSTNAADYWPQVLYDTREALQRDTAPANAANLYLSGAMYYMTLDVANLTKWFQATAPFAGGTGANSKKDNGGFTVYFSDRRNNRNASSKETAEFGWEDFVNPLSATGTPSTTLDVGEDVNANGLLDVYGGIPNYNGAYNAAPPGAALPLNTTAGPTTVVNSGQVQVNRSILFRHALKLINGNNIIGSGVTGLTIVAENPVYVQGDWNANGAWVNPDAATAVMADAVTLLSNGWSDLNSFTQPYAPGNRNRGTQTWYRLGIIGGKGIAFPQPAGAATDFGTDGGAHNFLRYLEDGDQQVNYQGSIVTLYYNRQAVGTYKCCNTVYTAPTRNYFFDVNFLTPSLLPPNTPAFRDIDAVGFSEELRPGK